MNRPLRILHVNPEHTQRGGERQCRLLIQAQLAQGHLPELFAASTPAWWEPLQSDKVDITYLRGRGGLQLRGLFALRRRLLRGDVDVLHLHSAHAHTLGRVASLGLRVPLVVHRRVDFQPSMTLLSKWKYRSKKQTYICVSHAIYHILRAAGVPADWLHVVHSAVECPPVLGPEARQRLLMALGLEGSWPLLGCIGQLVPHKNQRLALEALPYIVAEHPKARLLLVGDGPERRGLEGCAAALGLSARVVFLGERRDATDILQLLDVLLVPSREEGLNTSIQDAQWSGVPVVAAAVGGIPELVQPERGWLLQASGPLGFAQGLLAALADGQERTVRSLRARAWIEAQGGVSRMAADIERIYRHVLMLPS